MAVPILFSGSGTAAAVWPLPGWRWRIDVSVPAGQVSGSGAHLSMPLRLSRASFGTAGDAMFAPTGGDSAPGNAQSNGGDLRAYTGPTAVTRLALDIVQWGHDSTTGAADADVEIYVRVPYVSAVTGATISLFYDSDTTQAQPAADAAYGSEAVWSDYAAVWHLGDLTDATGNGNTLSVVTAGTSTAGPHATLDAYGVLSNRTLSDYSRLEAAHSPDLSMSGAMTFQVISYLYSEHTDWNGLMTKRAGTAPLNYGFPRGPNGHASFSRAPGAAFNTNAGQITARGPSDTYLAQVEYSWHGVFEPGVSGRTYEAGSLVAEELTTGSTLVTNSGPLYLTALSSDGTSTHRGYVDEARLRAEALSADWIATEEAARLTPSTFYSTSSAVGSA